MSNKKRFWSWLKIILICYAVIGIAFYYLQDSLLFHPKIVDTKHPYAIDQKYTEVNIPLSNTDTIHMLQFSPANPAKGLVIYFHGNRDNVQRYARFIDPFLKNNFEVWIPDYPGFGKSRGVLTEQSMYTLGWQVQKLASTEFSADSIVIYGKSLGTGLAAYVAANSDNKMLILETPYYSLKDAVSKYLWMYPVDNMMKIDFPTYKYLPDVKCPIIIFHGTNDGVIRYSSAEKLQPLLRSSDAFYTLPGETHNSVNVSPVYYKAIDSLLH